LADIVDSATRSRMMSGIRSKNTKPELMIRKALHARGFRYRIHCKDVPGNPDLCLPKYRAVIFVHGCFWHGHDCHLFKWPKTRPEFWAEKISQNSERDYKHALQLSAEGWRICTVWECSLKGKGRLDLLSISSKIESWLYSERRILEVAGSNTLG
jgi:DNA mismatch endonuclease (patch repair protein)